MHLQLGEVPFVIVSSVDAAKQVVKTHDIAFANRPPMVTAGMSTYNYTDVAFAPYGEYWRHVRRISTLELLSARRVQSFRPIREEESMFLAQWIASKAGTTVNVSERAYHFTFHIAARVSIGGKIEHQEAVTATLRELLMLGSGLSFVDLFPSSSKLLSLITGIKFKTGMNVERMDKLLDSILDQHRSAARDATEDLADVLLRYQQDDEAELRLTNDNIKAILMDMFGAGGDTSAVAVEWAMSEMMKNPSILKRAQEEVRSVYDSRGNYVNEAEFHELKYLKLVIKETMRLHPPVPLLLPRYNTEKCEINGYEVPAKTTVLINVWALGRDPKYWNDAEKFVPERFVESSVDFKGNNLEYIPFGAGRRICPGISFAMATVEFALATLLYHFDWEMPEGIQNEELDMTEAFGTTVARKHELYLIPTLKRPLQLLK